MALIKLELALTLLFFFKFSSVNTSFCFWNSGCSYKYFSNKTPYNSVRGDIRDSNIKIQGCEPISIWVLYKHGKRYPDKVCARNMEDAVAIRNHITASYDNGNCSLCAQDVDNLKNWRVDRNLFKGVQTLTEEGYQEMFATAKRLQTAYSNILTNLKPGEYVIGLTGDDNIEESTKAYISGFGAQRLSVDQGVIDKKIAPYLSCEKYQTDVKMNPKTYEEAAKYQKSLEYLAMVDRIQRRTGISIKLSENNVTALYDLCRYTWSGVDSKPSPWCALFTSEDLQILEYIEDLKLYYKNGYGTAINELLGRITLADLLKSFQQAKLGRGKKITAYFTRSTAVDMTLSALGLFKDKETLSGSKINRDRKWRSWRQSTFSSNIMAVLSKCGKNGRADYNVVFYLNEQPIKSICGEGICPWNEFEDKLKPFVDTDIGFCDLNTV